MSDNHRLSRIETLWSVVQRAHEPDSQETAEARASLLDRYGDAVRRYLMASLRDADAVDDAFQEFSLRFVRGDFANVSPEKGRFRNYLKTVVYHLIADFGRARKKFQAVVIEHESMLVAPQDDQAQALDAQFLSSWRESLLHQAWERLREEESASGKPWYTVLRSRAEHPEARSHELSEIVTDRLGRDVSPGNIRVLLHRARDRFAEILSADVRESLANADADRLRMELQDLNLWTYCRHLHESSPEVNS